MIKNPFFSLEPYGKIPRRVFALFDQRSDEWLYLEAVDADWFDQSEGRMEGFADWMSECEHAPLHVLEMHGSSEPGLQVEALRPIGPGTGRDQDRRGWLEISLDPGGTNAGIYHGLFANAVPVGVQKVAPALPAAAARLDNAFSLASKVATAAEIQAALPSPTERIDWIGVYDVGQGSANGLCDDRGLPLAYFDLGGGVLANKGSFPLALTNICFTARPPVVLSHWDWDHWSSAARFPKAQSLTWIVPDQKLGAVHSAMAAAIARSGSLLVWPPGLASLSAGQIRIEKCTGTSGRNHSGLAMLVDGPEGELPIMLPGDARYSAIPSGSTQPLSIVIAHHGADMGSAATPLCPHAAASRVAYSYGPANTFAHPRSTTFSRHHANGWKHRSLQPAGAIDRHTSDLRPALGHIGLGWSASAPLPLQPCGGQCLLHLAQR